uniref:Putative secreted protein n=1 Tax=Ornithodoros turicata TaxID=34597 RepID=A0A2R5LMI3_9ACAR
MFRLVLVGVLLAVCLVAVSADFHEYSKKHHGEKKIHADSGETWKKLHQSNKHSKERFHAHKKHVSEKDTKTVQKHGLPSVSHHEASLQGDILVNRKAAVRRQHDSHRADLHLQDLSHSFGGHHSGRTHGHHEKPSHAKATKHSDKHPQYRTPVTRAGHQIHRPIPMFDFSEEQHRPVHLHTNSRARAALRVAKMSRRVHGEGKPRKFKKAFEKKSHSKPHYLW